MSVLAQERLKSAGQDPDETLDPACLALFISAIRRPGLSLGRYFHHLGELVERVRAEGQGKPAPDETVRLAILRKILFEECGYRGSGGSEDLSGYDLSQVIDTAKGSDVALAALYLHAARAQDWAAHALFFGPRTLVRLEEEGRRLIFDPVDPARPLQANDLRRILKDAGNPSAELSAAYYQPAGNRDLLTRLQNPVKLRQIALEDYGGAVETIETMLFVDPGEYRLRLDLGVLLARLDRKGEAVDALNAYIEQAPPGRDREEAAFMRSQILQSLSSKVE